MISWTIEGTELGTVSLILSEWDSVTLEFGLPRLSGVRYRGKEYKGDMTLVRMAQGDWVVRNSALYTVDYDHPTEAAKKVLESKALTVLEKWAKGIPFREAQLRLLGMAISSLKAKRENLSLLTKALNADLSRYQEEEANLRASMGPSPSP